MVNDKFLMMNAQWLIINDKWLMINETALDKSIDELLKVMN